MVVFDNLNIVTAGKEEEASECFEAALGIDIEEEGEVDGEGEEGGDGTQRVLGALEFLTQEAETSGTILVDVRNGLNELIQSAMMWTVQHRYPAGTSFAFNCYRNWAQLLLRQLGEPPVTILIREGVTQEYPLLIVLYVITLVPLAKELRAADQGLLSSFYADDAAFYGSAR